MNLLGKIIRVMPLQTGTSKNGPWRKQDIIVETDGQYSKKICVSIWGDNIDEAQLVNGKTLDISFDLESREFNDKWYTDVKARKINLFVPISSSIPADLHFNIEDTNQDDDGLPF